MYEFVAFILKHPYLFLFFLTHLLNTLIHLLWKPELEELKEGQASHQSKQPG